MEESKYKIKIDSPAVEDLNEITKWYESKVKSLGMKFYLRFLDALEYLKINPFLYEKKIDEIRRVKIKKFPYTIYYLVKEKDKQVLVLAVWGEKRNPESLKKRF